MNLVELANQSVDTFGNITKLIFKDTSYSNLDLISAANRFANGLIDLDIAPGDKVMVQMMNSPEVVIAYQAILRAGAVIIPVIYTMGEVEIRHILENSGACAMITEETFLKRAGQAAASVDSLKHLIVMDETDTPHSHRTYKQLTEAYPATAPEVTIQDDDTAVILYTSGTTGTPKGVMLTHKNLYASAVSLSQMDPHRDPETVSLFFLPLSHSFGLSMMNLGFLIPNKSVVMPRFDLEEACRLIERHRIYKFAGVPAVFSLMLHHENLSNTYDLSSLKECSCGSAPLPKETLTAFEARFNCIILEGYGLSEAAPTVAGNTKERIRKPGSVGPPVPGVQVRIVDHRGKILKNNEVGELLVQGDNISPGYYNMPDETARSFKGGWLYTGDMAFQDDEGDIFIVDRKKDLIIRGGFNICPRDVESVLHDHPAVDEAAVIGVPDPIMGEEILAYIILLPGARVTEKALLAHCYKHISKSKCPRKIRVIDAMPRNALGKILKKDLRVLYQGETQSGPKACCSGESSGSKTNSYEKEASCR